MYLFIYLFIYSFIYLFMYLFSYLLYIYLFIYLRALLRDTMIFLSDNEHEITTSIKMKNTNHSSYAIIIQSESIKTQHFKIRAWISMYMLWLGRVIISIYFDTTFDEYCFTDDVTAAGFVTEVKIPCANFYIASEWETQLKK